MIRFEMLLLLLLVDMVVVPSARFRVRVNLSPQSARSDRLPLRAARQCLLACSRATPSASKTNATQIRLCLPCASLQLLMLCPC